jgi:hypothetical protein
VIGLLECDTAANGAGAGMPGFDADLGSCRRFDDPLELDEVARRFVVAA